MTTVLMARTSKAGCKPALLSGAVSSCAPLGGSSQTGARMHLAALHPKGIFEFQLQPLAGTIFFVAAGVPPAVDGGILPPDPAPGLQPDPPIIQPSRAGVRLSAGRDARFYGRRDARRYRKMIIRCSGGTLPAVCGRRVYIQGDAGAGLFLSNPSYFHSLPSFFIRR